MSSDTLADAGTLSRPKAALATQHHGTVKGERGLRRPTAWPERDSDRPGLPFADQRCENEPGEPEGDERIADAGDIRQQRQRHGDDVGDRSGVEEEGGAQLGRQQRVEGSVEVARRHPNGRQRRFPHRHPASVDDDRNSVGSGSQGDRDQAGLAAVRPEGENKEQIRAPVERQPELVSDLEPRGDGHLRVQAQEQGRENEDDPAQPDVDQASQPAVRDEPQDQPQDQPDDDQFVGPVKVARAVTVTASR